jgi:hypothetical protein
MVPDVLSGGRAAVDGKAQARTVGGDKFTVEIAGPFSKGATPAVVKDNMNGTYDVTWHTDTAGEYLINAKLDGFAVGGCPVRCTGMLRSPSPALPRKCPNV